MKSFSWKKLQNKIKSMNRTDWLVVLMLGVLLLVIAIPTGQSEEAADAAESEIPEETENQTEEDALAEYRKQLETELAGLLSQMDGVGRVEVMLTLKDSGAYVLDKKVKRDGDTSETETVVYQQSEGEEPYVTNRFSPDVEGVLIVAEGASSAVTVSDISDAVMALFGIEAHKIKIVKMSD